MLLRRVCEGLRLAHDLPAPVLFRHQTTIESGAGRSLISSCEFAARREDVAKKARQVAPARSRDQTQPDACKAFGGRITSDRGVLDVAIDDGTTRPACMEAARRTRCHLRRASEPSAWCPCSRDGAIRPACTLHTEDSESPGTGEGGRVAPDAAAFTKPTACEPTVRPSG